MSELMKSTLFHPFIFAFFPIIFIFSANTDILQPNEIILPFIIMTITTLILIVLIRKILRKEKTSIIISSGLILFFSYGYIFNLFDNLLVIKEIHVFGGVIGIFVIVTILFSVTKKKLDNFTKITNVIAISIISISAISIVTDYVYPSSEDQTNVNNSTLLKFDSNIENKPNVYFIILDAYSGSEILEDMFEFNNSKFTSFLENKGFNVVKNSHSNYASTEESISSTFNMNYVHERIPNMEGKYKLGVVGKTIDNNTVMKNFKELGYKIINFNSGVGFTRDLQIADNTLCEKFGGDLMNLEMIRLLTKNSMLFPIQTKLYQSDMRDQILCIYSEVTNIEKTVDEPFFAFVHIFIPHRPFIFDQDGNPTTTENIDIADIDEDKEGYINQLIFANKKTEEIINKILDTSESKPIIIIQGDHGATVVKGLESFNQEAIKERYSILNAYYFPSEVSMKPYEGISSVNTFRLIFNNYFGSNYELLEDRSYIIDSENSKSIDVTEYYLEQ
jgi:hypothetical protein